ncbi:MAG TPA: thioesterase family protein [Anaeromyxobacteraceae bacterium]|nr:thioesterase family protein [Anaeromyxobacteraceae bacterium]
MVTTTVRVIYGDTDQMGVVYYANYLRYFEAGRNEFIRAKGVTYREFEDEHGLALPVVEVAVRYRQPARYDDLLSVEVALSEIRRASARFEYRVTRAGDLIATGHTIHACVDGGGRARRMPENLLARLRTGEETV